MSHLLTNHTMADFEEFSAEASILDRIVSPHPPDFALLYRPNEDTTGAVELLIGNASNRFMINDIPGHQNTHTGAKGPNQTALVLLPYRQILERGYSANDDGSPIIVLEVTEQATASKSRLIDFLPDTDIRVTSSHFSLSDGEYEAVVRNVINDEIGTGEGANFVIRRDLIVDMENYSPLTGLTLFRKLLERESGTYWTFIVYCNGHTLVGASPERHVSLSKGLVTMNPISGTYRYPESGVTIQGITDFLRDVKETDELYMVVDEELKMMARICDEGGRILGPRLKEMAKLAHVEYVIKGQTRCDLREILRETMFAPTVMGSPLESSARVVEKYEPDGRGYYSGVIALVGQDADGSALLDSAIIIRTADIDSGGHAKVGVGATLVRHSDPAAEAQETRAKAAALLDAFQSSHVRRFAEDPLVRLTLAERNRRIAPFWLNDSALRRSPRSLKAPLRGLMIDAEDTFTAMLRHHLRAQGVEVDVRRYDELYSMKDYDVVVMGPGPGDPSDARNPKMVCLHAATRQLLNDRIPFLSVCLSHQILCTELGYRIARRDTPNQGVQKEIELFGSRETVGFYNTFAGLACTDEDVFSGIGPVQISRDPETCEIYALQGLHFVSMQFHPESLLTLNGTDIIAKSLRRVCK